MSCAIVGEHRHVAATGIAAWFAYYSCSMVYWSYTLGDVSQGMDATPLWIPQLSMALGTVLFAIAKGRRLGRQIDEEPLSPIPSGELVKATAGQNSWLFQMATKFFG